MLERFLLVLFFFIATSTFLSCASMAQSAGKFNYVDDTLVCYNLVSKIDNEGDQNIWIKYNNQLLNLCETRLKLPSLSSSQKSVFLKYKSMAYTNKGAYYVFNDDIENGIIAYRTGLHIAKQLNFLYTIVVTNQNIGTAKDRLGQLDSVIYYLREAYLFAQKANDISLTAYVLTDLGYAFNNIGDYSTAISYNIKALKLFEKLNDTEGIERTCFAIGRIFDTQNESLKALEYYQRCEKLSIQLKNEGRQVMAIQSIANDLLLLNKIEDALKVNDKAVLISKKINSKNSLCLCYKLYGDIYVRKNNLKLARENYLKSANIAKLIHSENFYQKAIYELANLAWQDKDYNSAQKYAIESYSIAAKLNYVTDIVSTSELLSKIFEQKNNYENAFKYKKIASEINDSLNKNKSKNLALKAEFKYQHQKNESQIELLNNKHKIVTLESKRKDLFLVLIIGSFISILIITYFLFRRYKDKKQNEFLLTKLKDAELLLNAERKASESEIKAIKSQMNPHFFYNALNSIQGFIYNNEKENAAKALGIFSDLSRAVLESSRHKEHSLYDEIEFLEKYLQLEIMRLPKIKFSILVAENIDVYDTFMPSMLLQPLVENAINHGLANKLDNCNLSLTFNIVDEVLEIQIDDTGIGRKAANEIGNRMKKKSATFSTKANYSRIELLNLNSSRKIEQQIIDKINELNEPLGTLVIIKIPINNYD